MPSRTIQFSEIRVEERQREDLGELQELVHSIEKYGLLQPIVVEEKILEGGVKQYVLRAGGRRLAAHALLKRTEIEALILGEMTELEAQLIELEENVQRKSLEWQEEVKAVKRIHSLKMAAEPNWTAERTAAIIGRSRRTVFNALELSSAIDSIPDVAAADKPLAAMNRLKRHKQIEQRKEDVQIRRLKEDRGMQPLLAWHIHNGDCTKYLPDLVDGFADMILTDPPWAVNYDDLLIGDQKSFDDSLDVLPKVRDAMRQCFRLLRDQRFCLMYWPTNETELPVKLLEELGAPERTTLHDLGRWFLTSAGFKVWPRPLIWYKPNKQFGSVHDPSKEVTSQYETIFLAFKGDARFFKRPGGDVFVADSPGSDRLHPNEKSVELSEVFVDMCTVHGETVLDPFCGGGAHGEATLLQERNFHGVELDREFFERADMRCESISQRKLSGELPALVAAADEDISVAAQSTGGALPNRAKIASSLTMDGLDNHLFDGE